MIANTVKDGALEITGGGVTIPPKKFVLGKLVKKKNPASGDTQQKNCCRGSDMHSI